MIAFVSFVLFISGIGGLISAFLSLVALLQGYTTDAKLCLGSAIGFCVQVLLCVKLLEAIDD